MNSRSITLQTKIFLVIALLFASALLIFVGTYTEAEQTLALIESSENSSFPALMTLDRTLAGLENYQLRLGDAIGQGEPEYIDQAASFAEQIDEGLVNLVAFLPRRDDELRTLRNDFHSFHETSAAWAHMLLVRKAELDGADPKAVQYRESLQYFKQALQTIRTQTYQKYQADIAHMRGTTRRTITLGFALLLMSLLASILSLFYTRKNIVAPIVALAEASIAVREGNFAHAPDWPLDDEIGHLNHNFNAMVSYLKEANQKLESTNAALQKSFDNLKHETDSRTAMVEDLAHRCNNPFHACRLDLESLSAGVKRIDAVISQMLGEESELDADAKQFLDQFHKMIGSLLEQSADAGFNLERAAHAIKEIRTMSGVDGHLEEWVELSDLMQRLHRRLEENLGKEHIQGFHFAFDGSDFPPILSNSIVLVVCLERLFRKWLKLTANRLQVRIQSSRPAPGKLRFVFFMAAYPVEHEQLLLDLTRSLAYILEQEQIKLSLEGECIILEGLAP